MDERIKLEALRYACACKAYSRERRKHDCFYLPREADDGTGYHFCVTENGCSLNKEYVRDEIVSDLLDKIIAGDKLGDLLVMVAIIHELEVDELYEFATEWRDQNTLFAANEDEVNR